MDRRKKIVFFNLIVIIAGLIILFRVDDNHRFDLRYLLWKSGIGHKKEHYVKYLNVDIAFRDSLLGKSKHEIEEKFCLISPENWNPVKHSNEKYSKLDFFWICNSGIGVEFKKEKLLKYHSVKDNL